MSRRFHYTAKQKLQILESLEEEKELDFEMPRSPSKKQIKDWNNKKEQYINLSLLEQPKTYTLHKGASLKYAELYTFLYSKVKSMRQEMIAINHNMLITIAIQEQPELAELSPSGQRSLIDRFMKQFNLSLRTITSKRPSLSQEEAAEDELIRQFKDQYIKTISDFQILEQNVYNMDQTGLNYEILPKKIIEKMGI